MDEFAQSRGDDDLFDDEIVPLPASQTTNVKADQNPMPATTISVGATERLKAETPVQLNGRGRGRGRGRGMTARDTKTQNLSDSKFAPKSNTPVKAVEKPALSDTIDQETSSEPFVQAQTETQTATPTDEIEAPKPPTGPSNPTPARPPAVKGDRLNTGGVQRPKLTEDELNAKLAAAKERNQNRAAAYAREQADAENFAEREKLASAKRTKENANRKVMEGERERNRERKLRGQGGREWDARKNEADHAGSGRGERRKWTGAEDEENDLSMYVWNEERGRGRGRGRGGRGERGGRGRGRGDNRNNRGGLQQSQPNVQADNDFPALPDSKVKTTDTKLQSKGTGSEAVSPSVGASWAEQVEAGEAAAS